jgi:hypothetical protein
MSAAPIFLGGTCGNSKWRDVLIAKLAALGIPTERLFNPVVPDWTTEHQAAENKAKKEAEFNLFYLASPEQEGNPVSTYSIVEAIMGLYDDPMRAIVVFDNEGYAKHALKALSKTEGDLRSRFPKGLIFSSMDELVSFLQGVIGAEITAAAAP